MNPREIFDGAEQGDEVLKKVVELYIRRLGIGIVNIVNIFRPQLILLGGGISARKDVLIPPIRKMMGEECFGGTIGELPKLDAASLGNEAGMIGAASLI